jgi:hypothetical protein
MYSSKRAAVESKGMQGECVFFNMAVQLTLRVSNTRIRIVRLEFNLRFALCCRTKLYDVITCITENDEYPLKGRKIALNSCDLKPTAFDFGGE